MNAIRELTEAMRAYENLLAEIITLDDADKLDGVPKELRDVIERARMLLRRPRRDPPENPRRR
jgi:hypothetical protein